MTFLPKKRNQKISVEQHLEELKHAKAIFRELQRTIDTNGEYNPYNITFPYQAEVVHEICELLEKRLVAKKVQFAFCRRDETMHIR